MKSRTEQDIQNEVNEALIASNMNPDMPFDVIKMAKQLGFTVRIFRTIPKNIMGFMFLQMDKKMSQMVKSDKLIGLNINCDEVHKRFAVAHELGHFIMHYDICKDGENPVFFQIKDEEEGIEGEACKFAAMLLMDSELFSNQHSVISKKSVSEMTTIRKLSEIFKAPQASVRRRIKELKLNVR